VVPLPPPPRKTREQALHQVLSIIAFGMAVKKGLCAGI
jgi:hypothetical protein